MGEQFIDLFAAGAYALGGRLHDALAQPSLSWIFYVLASAGLLAAFFESAAEQRPDMWLRHLVVVCLAAVLIQMPQQVALADLTYASPGAIESALGTRVGAAPQLTVWVERLGASAAIALRSLGATPAPLMVPGVFAQVREITSDPATVADPQLRANLDVWRRRILPQIFLDHPDLQQQVRDAGLEQAMLNPIPASAQFVGDEDARRSQAVQQLLAANAIDLQGLVQAEEPLIAQSADVSGATPWSTDPAESGVQVQFSARAAPSPGSANAGISSSPAYQGALQRADELAGELRSQLTPGNSPVTVQSADQLYDLLGRSVLYNAGVAIAGDTATRSTIGSLCQRSGEAVCRSAMAPLVEAAGRLNVSDPDRYSTANWTTFLQQPIAGLLLLVTSLLLKALSTLVVSVLPFALGIAKAMAILVSTLGTWLLLWPGRARVALMWMLGPISFVSLWSVLFNLWAVLEPSLGLIANVVQSSPHGSWAAVDAMSIAIALGYMGLPSLALGIVYGQSGRALYHASARIETALMTAWHTRGTMAAFGRRWLVNSPLARRWNQRAYRAIGLGPLPSSRRSSAPYSTRAKTPVRSRQAQPASPAPADSAHDGPPSPRNPAQGELFGDGEPPAVTRKATRRRK